MSMDLEGAIRRAVNDEAQRVISEEIAAATQRVETRLREKTAEIAMSVLKHYEVSRDRDYVVIKVHHIGVENAA